MEKWNLKDWQCVYQGNDLLVEYANSNFQVVDGIFLTFGLIELMALTNQTSWQITNYLIENRNNVRC